MNNQLISSIGGNGITHIGFSLQSFRSVQNICLPCVSQRCTTFKSHMIGTVCCNTTIGGSIMASFDGNLYEVTMRSSKARVRMSSYLFPNAATDLNNAFNLTVSRSNGTADGKDSIKLEVSHSNFSGHVFDLAISHFNTSGDALKVAVSGSVAKLSIGIKKEKEDYMATELVGEDIIHPDKSESALSEQKMKVVVTVPKTEQNIEVMVTAPEAKLTMMAPTTEHTDVMVEASKTQLMLISAEDGHAQETEVLVYIPSTRLVSGEQTDILVSVKPLFANVQAFPSSTRVFSGLSKEEAPTPTTAVNVSNHYLHDINSISKGCHSYFLTGLNHVAFCVENLDRSLEFYSGLLGLEQIFDRPKLPYNGAWLLVGSHGIHLMEVPNPDPVEGRPAKGGFDRHACINVENLEGIATALEKAGIPYERSMVPSIFARDPDANGLEFIEATAI